MQNQLIRCISKQTVKVKPVQDIREGMDVIKSKIHSKKILLILDDADQTNLISRWAGERYSFHPGSRIIIVSEDVAVLRKNKVYEREIYHLEKLSEDESVKLFNFYAFGREAPSEQYQELSMRIIPSMGRLPLNLKVFGSFFSDLRNIGKWEEVLEKLTSHGTVHKDSSQSTSLGQNAGPFVEPAMGSSAAPSKGAESRQNLEPPMRSSMDPSSTSNRDTNSGKSMDSTIGPNSSKDSVSYTDPEDPDPTGKIIDLDPTCKEIFLDIACFFIGTNRETAMHIWRGCEFSRSTTPEGAIQKLLSLSLLTIKNDDTFDMHEKIRDKGRKMVEGEDEELGKRSRLWEHGNSLHVLSNRTATDRIQGISLNLASAESLSTQALSPLSKLRLMSVDNAAFNGGFKGLPMEPRWLKWQGSDASTSFPRDFNLDKVAVLDISKCRLKPSTKPMKWMQSLICGSSAKKDFDNLKVLELNSSENQTAFPDVSNFPCLDKLTVDGCRRLAEVFTSFERLRRLTCLKIRNCTILQSLPANFSSLVSLKILDLSGCSSLSDLPGEVGNLKSLMELLLSGTAVKLIPNSINQLTNLERLLLDDCKELAALPETLGGLNSLQEIKLDMSSRINVIPQSLGDLKQLKELSAKSCTSLVTLPTSIGNASSLTRLLLDGTMIEVLPDTVGQLENLSECSVCLCTNLRRLPQSLRKLRCLKVLNLNATGILQLPVDIGALSSLAELQMAGCTAIRELPENFINLRMLSSLDLRNNSNLVLLPSLRDLSQLKQLYLLNCDKLLKIRQLPSSLTKLFCNGCTALEGLEDVSNLENLIDLHLSCCINLTEINGIDSLVALRRLHMSGCKKLSDASRNRLVQEMFKHLESFSIPGCEIPRFFTSRPLSYEVPLLLDVKEGMELLMCMVVAVEEHAGCWEPSIKVHTEAEGEKIVKLSGVALPGNEDNLCLWRYEEADGVFPRGNVNITLEPHKWMKDKVKTAGLCEPRKEVQVNDDERGVSVFQCISRCCRRSNSV